MAESNRPSDDGPTATISETIRAEFDWADVDPSTAVVETVATAADRDPMELEPLYNTVDTDALDNLLRSGNSADGTTTVSFTFEGHGVTAQREGSIIVRPIEPSVDAE